MRQAWSAPGRVNLIGEHTDYNDGLALPFAIDRTVVVHLAEAETDDLVSPYVEGVAEVLRQDGYPVPPTSVRITSDVPIGAGLSSSAALTCATALGLNDLYGFGLARQDLVLIAQRAENEHVGVPTGILDQSASLLCTTGHALLLDCHDRSTRQVPLDLAGMNVLVIDTGVTHRLADGSYGERRAQCERAARQLGVRSLREAEGTGALRGVSLRRARHVLTENQRVRAAIECLESGDVAELGRLITATHASLRDDFEVSWPAADEVVRRVLAAGALGARMIGGGFGGSVLVLAEDQDAVRSAVAGLAREVFAVRPAAGASRL